MVDCLSNSSLYKEFIKQSVLGVPSGAEVDPKVLKGRLKKIDKELERLRESSIKAQILSSIDDAVMSTATFNQQLSQVILEKDAERQGILKELKSLSSQKKWVDWLGDFKSHIDKLTSNDMSQKDKKRFLSGVIDEIVVTTVDTQTHQLDVHFRLPFVGSELSYRDKGKKTLGYAFVNGGRILSIPLSSLKKNSIKDNDIKCLIYHSHSSRLQLNKLANKIAKLQD